MKIILCPNPFRDKGLKAAYQAQRILSAAGAKTEYCFPFPVEKSNIGDIDPSIKIKEMKTELPDADFWSALVVTVRSSTPPKMPVALVFLL